MSIRKATPTTSPSIAFAFHHHGKVRDLSKRLELEQFVGQDPAIARVITKLEVR